MKRLPWKWLILLSLMMAVGFVFLLPSILGSKWVYQPLVERLADEQFSLKIEDVQLGWFRPLAFRGLQLTVSEGAENQDQRGSQLVSIKSIQSDRSLLGFLWGGRNLGTIEVIEPNIDIRLLENGNNLERIVRAIEGKKAPVAPTSSKKTPPKMDVTIVVKGFHVSVTDVDTGQPVMVIPPVDTAISYKSLDVNSQVVIEPTKVLDRVVITQELVHLGLAKAVPLLAQSTEFDGSVSLECQQITVPLEHPEESTGSAQLTLHQVRSVPTHPTILTCLDILGRLFQTEVPHELVFVDGSRINVEVGGGVVKHGGVRAGLPRVDQRLQIATSGAVGIKDRSLILDIEIPVPLAQLARKESIKQLGVPSITLPVRGTLEEPELDWKTLREDSAGLLSVMSSVLGKDSPLAGNLVGALSNVAEGQADQAIETGVDLVKELVQRHHERKKSQQDSGTERDSGSSEQDSPKKSRPLRDTLKNILRGNN